VCSGFSARRSRQTNWHESTVGGEWIRPRLPSPSAAGAGEPEALHGPIHRALAGSVERFVDSRCTRAGRAALRASRARPRVPCGWGARARDPGALVPKPVACATRRTRWGRHPAPGTSCPRRAWSGGCSRTRRSPRDLDPVPSEPGRRGSFEDLPFLAERTIPPSEPLQLFLLSARQTAVTLIRIEIRLLQPVAGAPLARLELLGQLAGLRPDRTSCMGLRRSSGGNGARLFGIGGSFLQSVKVSTKPWSTPGASRMPARGTVRDLRSTWSRAARHSSIILPSRRDTRPPEWVLMPASACGTRDAPSQ
jgi:hypothetical protein